MKHALSLIGAIVVGFIVGTIAATVVMLAIALVGPAPSPALQSAIKLVGGLAGAGLGLLRWSLRSAPLTSDVHGTARFASQKEAQRLLGGDGLLVGRGVKGELLRYGGPAHLLTIAPTRSGKGVGAIIPNLLTADRSVLCIDPKGENARIAARARRRLGPGFVLDPFEVSGEPGAAFNPLAGLRDDSLDLAEDAALIAEALVYDPPRQVSDAHWNEEAKALLAGVILHVVSTCAANERNLVKVRALLTDAPQAFQRLLLTMQSSGAAGGLVARAANRHLAKSERETAGVLSSAHRHTHFLDSPRIARVLSRSDFKFADLKSKLASVFLVLPPDWLATHARWMRLMVVQAISALARTPSTPWSQRRPVLLMLDEFAALGRLEPVERAFGLMAGYGLQLWAILQDLHQLKAAYGEAAGTFLSNAGLIQVFNVADVDTATWVSRSLGAATQVFTTTGQSTSRSARQLFATHGHSTHAHVTRRDLMTPDEVMRLRPDHLLLLQPGSAPVIAQKLRYYADPEFRGMADAQARS
jgi:type IV secretion system protein VirD4